MKKRMSVAGLALQLTAFPMAVLFVLVSAAQMVLFVPPHEVSFGYSTQVLVFEHQLEPLVPRIGSLGFLLTALVLIWCCSSHKRCDFSMTLSRLGISEAEVRRIFALVFTGYFLLYWALQFGTVTALYARSEMLRGQDPLWFFLACYRSPYLHLLMPLREVLGYVRNVSVCLAFGAMAALCLTGGSRKVSPLQIVPFLFWCVMNLSSPGRIGLWTTDVFLILAAAAALAGSLWMTGRRISDEKI